MDKELEEALKSYLDGNRAPWVESRLAEAFTAPFLSTIRAQEEEIAGLRKERKSPSVDGTIIIEAVELYPEAKEMARTCLGFTLEDGAEEIRLIAEYLFSRGYALNERIRELADDDSCCAAERAKVAELRADMAEQLRAWRALSKNEKHAHASWIKAVDRAEAAEAKVAALEKDLGRVRGKLDRLYKIGANMIQGPMDRDAIDSTGHKIMDITGLPSYLSAASEAT